MTRLLLAFLVASNSIWLYVRATGVETTPRRATPSAPQEAAELERRIEEAREDLRAAGEEEVRRAQAAGEAAERQRELAERRAAAGAKITDWYGRLYDHDEVDSDAVRAEVRSGIRSDDPATVLAAVQVAGFVAQHDALRRQARAAAGPPADGNPPLPQHVAEQLEPLRPLLLPFLDSPDEELRYAAAQALRAVGVEPEDLPRLLALEGDTRLRATLPHLLRQAAGDPVPASVREVVLRLLDDKSTSVVDHTLAAWGTTDLGPAYLEKVIDLAGRPETSRSAISRVLGRLEEKPDRVIDLLLDAVLSQQEGTSEAAIEGLKHEVKHSDRIADFFSRLLQLRNDPQTQMRCLEVLAHCGRQRMIPVLQAWASEVEPPPYVLRRFNQTIEALRERP